MEEIIKEANIAGGVHLKAVVMAGGEGSRLRPLTSKRPKPMLSVANKPVMSYIIELLAQQGFTELVATLQFLPEHIKNYYGKGHDMGVEINYAVEESPLGTAGSVKNAAKYLSGSDYLVIISGDALTDIDLRKAIEFHKEKNAMATLVLKKVDNPLEFGVTITDDEGRIERFLEKPTWGQVFSDTINTGIYILNREILDHIPADTSFDFSSDLFPALLEQGYPLYGYIAEGYWCDIGSLEQFLQAQHDLLAGKVKADIPGIRMGDDIWVGSGAIIDPRAILKGPLVIGDHARIQAGAEIRPYSVIGDNVVIGSDSVIERSVVLDNSYIGAQCQIFGTVVGQRCDLKRGVRLEEGVVVGDECLVEENALVTRNVKIYPHKTVDAGAVVNSNLIWETRGMQSLFGKEGISGLSNIDITPELAVRVGIAFGSSLSKGAHMVVSRDASPASRMIKRALLAGLSASGIHVRDLQIAPSALNRFLIRTTRSLAGAHVRSKALDPEAVQITFYDEAGIDIDTSKQRSVERHYFRGEGRRAFYDELGEILYPARIFEYYSNQMVRMIDLEKVTEKRFKLVIDYAHGSTSLVMPSLLGKLNCQVIAINPYTAEEKTTLSHEEFHMSLNQISQGIRTFNADLGILLDSAGERIYLVDDQGRAVDTHQALMLLCKLIAAHSPKKGELALPLNASHLVEKIVAEHGCQVTRTPVQSFSLMKAALTPNVIFAGSVDGEYIFPRHLPAYDAVASLLKILDLLAKEERPLSELIQTLPPIFFSTAQVFCPWDQKGMLMRRITEELKEKELLLMDGVKVVEEGLWTLMLPDPQDPLVYIFAEGGNQVDAHAAVLDYTNLVNRILGQ